MPALIVLAVVAAIAVAFISNYLKQQRIAAWRLAASTLGMQYAPQDPFGLDALDFTLFGKGDGRGCENVVWGSYHDRDAKVFDYWYYEVSTDPKGNTTRSYHRFTCALMPTALRAPRTTLARETVLTRLADAVGMHDIDFESEEFNRAYQIKSDDRKFASYLVDARMMEWLLTIKGIQFEAVGDAVLVATGKLSPTRIEMPLEVARAFCEQIPNAARQVFGT